MIPTSALISVPFHGDVRSAATPSAAGLGRLIGQGHALAAADLFDPAGEFAEVAGAGGADGPTFNFCHILRQLNQHRQKLTEHGLYGILSSLQNCDIRLDPCQPFVAHHRPLTVLTSISLLTPRVTIRLRVETVAENHLVRFLAQADAAPKVHAAISMPGICFPEHRPMAGVRLIKYSERGNMPARKPILCQESEFSAPAAREVRRASAVGVFNRLHKGLHMTHNPDTTSPSVSALALTISDLIPSSLDGNSSRLPSDAGRAHPRPWLRAHGRAGPPSRPDTGDVSYHRALMVTYQGCPQTPGGRIRALGFARMGARGRRRGPIPAMCQYQGSPVSRPRLTMNLESATSVLPRFWGLLTLTKSGSSSSATPIR